MNFLSLIEAKRDGQPLSPAQFEEIIQACTAGQLPDYQVAAFLMAVYFRGLSTEETAALTRSMLHSGETLDLPRESKPIVDKHSTGGVGDKVSLPLAPLLACLGYRVPMISGRGLGITGGTLDKLDSIPGFRTTLRADEIKAIVQSCGCVICGQTEAMVPADRKLYALRDVTGTVPSIPLIVASILSKKLAEGLEALVLDVKHGAAAFMKTRAEARDLATRMVTLASQCGVNTRALITNMDTPLGRAAGNWLEVKEAVECLEGRGPEDLKELVVTCAAHLLVQTNKSQTLSEALALASDCLGSGRPLQKWNEMLKAQGADLAAFEQKLALASTGPFVRETKATRSGYIQTCDAGKIGELVRNLGGGRLTKDSTLDYDAGVDQLVKPGEFVEKGVVLGRVHARTRELADSAAVELTAAYAISDTPPTPQPLISDIIPT